MFGLGQKTGVEIPESKGILAGKEYREARNMVWNPGDTVQAAIGQSDNAFTPLQLSMYTSTLANGGTRYNAHFIKSVYNYSMTQIKKNDFSQVLSKVDIPSANFEAVKSGMLQVTEDGTASATFSNYPIRVGGKTGTAQTTGPDNSVLVLFAPYEDPEIAVSIVIEHGERSVSTGPVAKAIMDEYFFGSNEVSDPELPNQLLK